MSELSDSGSRALLTVHDKKRVSVELDVHSDSAIPKQAKSLLKSGKLSVKDMPMGKFNELYQDYVCSAILRVARELFAILPVDEVIVSARAQLLDSSTGRLAHQVVVSAFIPRESLQNMDFMRLDPSDAMKNFKHNMGFKRSIGLSAVAPITY